MIERFGLRLVVICGIAGGVRGKLKIGQVVVADRVVAYESAAEATKRRFFGFFSKSTREPRPQITSISHGIQQDTTAYLATLPKDQGRIHNAFIEAGGSFPVPPPGQEEEYDSFVASRLHVANETIASGEKLIKNPQFIRGLQQIHGKVKAFEMEAHGVLESCRQANVDWVVVRGISDFGDHLKSDDFHKTAAMGAATVAVDLLRNGIDLDHICRPPTRAQRDREAWSPDRHAANTVSACSGLVRSRSEREFELKVSVAASYQDLVGQMFISEGLEPIALADPSMGNRFIINAPGGSGKTAILKAIALGASKNLAPFVVDLGLTLEHSSLPRVSSDESSVTNGIEQLLNHFSIAGNARDFLEATERNDVQCVLLVDGLNEVAKDRDEILELLHRAVAKHGFTVVVADRMNPRSPEVFRRVFIEPLARAQIRAEAPNGVRLDDNDFDLLSMPFFFDLQLYRWKHQESPTGLLNRGELLNDYFLNVAGLSSDEMKSLQAAAFKMYQTKKTRTFDEATWSMAVKKALAGKLHRTGTTKPSSTNPKLWMFQHQLFHDYLVGRYMASLSPKKWTYRLFDAATFQAAAAEPLSFAAETIGDRCQEFLLAVYDWNYSLALECIRDLERFVHPNPAPPDLQKAFTALLGEKQFDMFRRTSRSATRRVGEIGTKFALRVQAAEERQALVDLVFDEIASPDYEAWRRIFTKPDDEEVSEAELSTLTSDPLAGWTTSNMLRRAKLSAAQQLAVRTAYRAAWSISIRWRAVHTLGAFPAPNNVAFLGAIVRDREENVWVRHGALRSLIENAYRGAGSVRTIAIETLTSAAENLDALQLRRELARHAVIEGATSDWYRTILPIWRRARDAGDHTESFWPNVLQEIEKLANEEVGDGN